MVIITLLSILAAGVLAFVTSPIYRAETVLVPETDVSAVGNSVLGQLGGLAALTGLGQIREASVTEAIALLKSRQFAEDFIRERNLMPRLFHAQWDSAASAWKSTVKPPTLWDGYREFDRRVRHVEEDRRSGIIILQIDWEDPAEAADWANDLVRRLNAQMKTRALREADSAIAYLTKEREKTDVSSVEQAIDRLIEVNLKERALANVREEYVFRVVDPAAPPDRKDRVKPHRMIYVITGAFFGLLLSVLASAGYDAIRNVRTWLREA